MIGTIISHYRITGKLGSGGMGVVYRARDTRLDREVAIKVLPREFAADAERVKRFEREAKATAALSHPNIIDVHDVGTHEGVPYLVEELLEGESLKDRLVRGAVPVSEAVGIAVQIAHGLAAAHEKGIVHRDLKPANVFVTTDGRIKILDFGLARLIEIVPQGETATVTQAPTGTTEAGRVLGTVGYMSPEQVRGQTADHRSDVFSFGCVLYEMLSGQSPFRKETAAETMTAILHEKPTGLAGTVRNFPLALERIVTRCLEKRPGDRFSSAHDLALALQATSSPGAAAGSFAGTGIPALTRRRSLLLAGGVLLITAIVATVVAWRPWHAEPAPAGSGSEHVPSVVALPTKVLGATEAAYLTDAVPSTLSTILAGVAGIDTKVPPNSVEVERVKGDLAKIAAAYQVENLILTTVTAHAGRLVLNVEVADAASRKVRWGRQYEGTLDHYNQLAREAAGSIVGVLKPERVRAAVISAPATNSEAELAFGEGKHFLYRYIGSAQPRDFELSLAAFERALQLDPRLSIAAGYAAYLSAYRHWNIAGSEPQGAQKVLKQAESWARRALALDPGCGVAWSAMAFMEAFRRAGDTEKALGYAVKGVSLAPRDALSSHTMGACSGPDFMVAAGLHSLQIDPLDFSSAGMVTAGLVWLGRPGEALGVVERALLMDPGNVFNQMMRTYALTHVGRLREAQDILERFQAASHAYAMMWRQLRFDLAVAQGDKATSEALARQNVAAVLDPWTDYGTVANAAFLITPGLARMGRHEEAMRVLLRSTEGAVMEGSGRLLSNPDLQPLRADPRFAKVAAAYRTADEATVRVLEQARSSGELPSYLEAPLDDLVRQLNEKK